MLPGQQKQSSQSKTDDNRQINRAVSLMDLPTKHGSPRVNERATFQRPPSPRLLSSSQNSLMGLELQRHFSVSGAEATSYLRDSSLREQNSTSLTPKGVRLKRTRSNTYNFDEALLESPNSDYGETAAPHTSATTTTIRKRENNRAAGAKKLEQSRTPKSFFMKSGGGKGNNDLVLQEKNGALVRPPTRSPQFIPNMIRHHRVTLFLFLSIPHFLRRLPPILCRTRSELK